MDNISKGLDSVSIKAAPNSETLTNGMLLKKKNNSPKKAVKKISPSVASKTALLQPGL